MVLSLGSRGNAPGMASFEGFISSSVNTSFEIYPQHVLNIVKDSQSLVNVLGLSFCVRSQK